MLSIGQHWFLIRQVDIKALKLSIGSLLEQEGHFDIKSGDNSSEGVGPSKKAVRA